MASTNPYSSINAGVGTPNDFGSLISALQSTQTNGKSFLDNPIFADIKKLYGVSDTGTLSPFLQSQLTAGRSEIEDFTTSAMASLQSQDQAMGRQGSSVAAAGQAAAVGQGQKALTQLFGNLSGQQLAINQAYAGILGQGAQIDYKTAQNYFPMLSELVQGKMSQQDFYAQLAAVQKMADENASASRQSALWNAIIGGGASIGAAYLMRK